MNFPTASFIPYKSIIRYLRVLYLYISRSVPATEDAYQLKPLPVDGIGVVEEAVSVDEADEKVEPEVGCQVVSDELEDVSLPLCQEVERSPEPLRSSVVTIAIDVLLLAKAVETKSLISPY